MEEFITFAILFGAASTFVVGSVVSGIQNKFWRKGDKWYNRFNITERLK